jgi:hypothetical protein
VILLDTNVVSAVMVQRPDPDVVAWLDQINPRQVWLPSVVVFELRYGAAIHPDASRRRKLELALKRLIAELIQERIAPLDARAAQQAALLAAQRKRQGRTVDLRDTLIAGIALAQEAQLATGNVRHFSDTTIGLINPFGTDPHQA